MRRLPVLAFGLVFTLAPVSAGQVLFDFEGPIEGAGFTTRDARIRRVARDGRSALRVETGREQPWPGVTLPAPDGAFDLSAAGHLRIDLRNAGPHAVKIFCRVDNPDADGRSHCITASLALDPGRSGTLLVLLSEPAFRRGDVALFGMRGSPIRRPRLDLANVTGLKFFVHRPRREHVFEIDEIRAAGEADPFRPPAEPERFFPFVDAFGQYAHRDWPGKTTSARQLEEAATAESGDLAAHPPPADRNRFGGWAAGPKLEATGHFRVTKHRGRWWFVDPEGRLFWSHGLDCVHEHAATPVTGRRPWFARLPAEGAPLARFYGRGTWAPLGYYRDHRPYRTYDFFRANLVRKYGERWSERFARRTLERLPSWGLNTIGNWSSLDLGLRHRVPYVCSVHVDSVKVEGSEGHWGRFPDVFDAAFRETAEKRFRTLRERIGDDPWCLGFFADNELGWGQDTDLAAAVLRSPSGQAAKQVFVARLRSRYRTIERLNASWRTRHASWDALRETREPPSLDHARDDLVAFSHHIARTYFRNVRDALKKAWPDHLYLGCRFAGFNEVAMSAAAELCDVVSYNAYRYDIEAWRLPAGLDRPVLVGEFHFGALDRGMFHPGLRPAEDQAHRAALYSRYVRGALGNPLIVGTHWFQYKDQPLTGRGDGENYQIGFVDGCDRPYPELVAAARAVGTVMYRLRHDDDTAPR